MTKARKKIAPEARSFGDTKHDLLVRMMQRPTGASSGEMEQATSWKPHSVRGLVGTLKKRGIPVESRKEPGSPVRYHIPAPADQVGDVI